ncbi:hypothetical protein FOCC_FOCC017667 [Frankliniella occidentalis]|nr:hypothetical protein FOCC_FOCC017667 [Frankliniella occidentalis]
MALDGEQQLSCLGNAKPHRTPGGAGCCGLCWRGGGLRKYVFLCAACGGASALLGVLFLAVYFILRSYTSSLVYFETVPTYIPASMLLSTGLVVMCLARRRNRYSFLMKLCGCACLASAALCVLVTVATTVVHMSRLQSLSQCHYVLRTQTCTCYSALVDATATDATEEGARYVFNAIPDCDVIHGALYSCLRAMFGLSVVGILVCIFSGMLVYQLFSHEKKKMYWEQLELRYRHLYRRQQTQPAGQALGQALTHTVLSHHCGSCSCCDDCRDLHTPPPSIPWEFMDSRYWAPGRVGNLYSPNPEDHHQAPPRPGAGQRATRSASNTSNSAWSWRRLPWGRSAVGGATVGAGPSRHPSDGGHGGALCIRQQNPTSPDSQYGFSASHTPHMPGLGPHHLGRDPGLGPYLLSQVYPAPQPHPRPFAAGPTHADAMGLPSGMPLPLAVPMPLSLADDLGDLGPQFYLWGPPPPYMSNPASAANSPARRDPSLPQCAAPASPEQYPVLVRGSTQRLHRCSAAGSAAAPGPAAPAADRPLSPGEDAASSSALDSLSSPEKTVPRKKRKKAADGVAEPSGDAEAVVQPDSPESPTPSPSGLPPGGAQAVPQAALPGLHCVRKTKKRTDAPVVPGAGARHSVHGTRYSHRARASPRALNRPPSADSCCVERSCCARPGDMSDDVDTEGYSYPRLKFPPPAAPASLPALPAATDSQAILAAFDNQAFQDGASEGPGAGPMGSSSNPSGAVKTLTLGPQGPLVCKKRPSDPNESEVYFGDDSSCCNVSEQHSSLTYEEPGQPGGHELRAFKLVHTHPHSHHVQQRSMDAALPMRPVSVHRPSASTLSDTAVVDPSSHYHLHPIDTDPAAPNPAAVRQRMPLPLPHQPSLAPDAQYESIADSNVYTYISPLSLGPSSPPTATSTPSRRSFKALCDSPRAAPDRPGSCSGPCPCPEQTLDDKENTANAQRESEAAAHACLDERPGIDV